MDEAKVFFAPVVDGESLESMAAKATQLCEAAGFSETVVEGQPCAIKTHFGEGENTGYIKPEIARAVAQFVKDAGGRPFLTDTNTLYRGARSQATDHLDMARKHGFTFEALGAPVIIADGLKGTDQVTVPIESGRHFQEVRIASAAYQAASAVVITHVKGHGLAGLAGSIKNVGMGFAARAGKLAQHHAGHPIFKDAECTACGTCVEWCPTDAIVMEETAMLQPERCIGCGECYALCPHGAIAFEWGERGEVFIEKVCEHVLGFVSGKRGHVACLNFLIDVTKDCDCVGHRQTPAYPNVGIFASTDIVAVDKAAVDVSVERYGKDIWQEWWPEAGYQTQFAYGEKIGMGTGEYELIPV